MKRIFICMLIVATMLSGCSLQSNEYEGTKIELSDDKITVNGKRITADDKKAVYCANDIVYYPAGKDFTYGEGTKEDEHEKSEADKHKVIHITKPGTYILSGKLSFGQIAVDLGKDAKTDPEAVVTLVLNGVDITCQVAPAVIFYNVYECGNADEEVATKDVDTSKAGANVIIADSTTNNIEGSYVAKIYKSYELNNDDTEVTDSKKLHKYDGAFYSKQTMNINGGKKGDGILNIKAENEGLNSELHLTVNGGNINIVSGNDGINTNEDNVSVTTINGGTVNILCNGSTGEGDGIDSNGWLVINGGSVTAQACATSMDAGIDSDKGIYINGGNLVAAGNMLDRIAGGNATYAVFNFKEKQAENNKYTLKNVEGNNVFECSPANAFSCLIIAGSELEEGDYTFYKGKTQLAASSVKDMPEGMPHQENPPMPPEFKDGDKPKGERPPMPDGETPPDKGFEHPAGMKGVTPPPNINGVMIPYAEPTTIFSITKGGNNFAGVCQYKSE